VSDIGDDFSALRKSQQLKRAKNRDSSTELLRANGIQFESKNDGAHLILAAGFDFWPGTGLWINKTTGYRGRGIAKLLRRVCGIKQERK
jgi:hypothetical protein